MKNAQWIPILTLTSIALAGCGSYDKNPVKDLNTMRENGQTEQNRGPEKPREITHETVVERPTLVVHEQTKVDENFLIISPDSEMTFVEGQRAAFLIHARALIPGVKIRVTGKNLPDGSSLTATPTATDKDLYTLTWTPALYTVPANAAVKTIKFKLIAQITEVSAEQSQKALEGLVREKEITTLVFRNQTPPSDLKVDNLPTEVAEGSLTRFDVTVKVPGLDEKTPQKPRLVVSYDSLNITPGNDYQELDGSRHIVADVNQKDAQYAGDSKWTFHLVFDTKNIGVQPPLSAGGTALTDSSATHVRLSFKVYNPAGASTPEVAKQLKINLNKPPTAPRFDLSGLGQEVLELTPGQKSNLSFFVVSGDPSAKVKVETPDLKTLPGSPTIRCINSSKGSSRQDCTLEWKVPCTATEHDLAQEIPMSAIATSGGRNSEPTAQTLKTQISKKPVTTCAAPNRPARKETTK